MDKNFFTILKSYILFLILSVALGVLVTIFSGLNTQYRGTNSQASSPYITVQGQQLYLNGNVFRFIGDNYYPLTSTSTNPCRQTFTPAQLTSELARIRTVSRGGVLRVWFFQSYFDNNQGFSSLDTLVQAAKQQGIYIIPVLENQYGDCEPSSSNSFKTLAWYQSGFKQTNDGYSLSYYNYIQTIAKHYASQTTIAFWQLMNEAEAPSTTSGSCNETPAASALRIFADTSASAIKSVDSNHLISLGTMGSGQCGASGGDYQYIHAGSNISLLEYHDYGANNSAIPGDQWNGLSVRIQQAKNLNKPLFIGEAGIKANVQSNGSESGSITQTTLNQRASDFSNKMIAQFNQGIVGYLIWQKGTSYQDMYEVQANDPTESIMARISTIYHLYYPHTQGDCSNGCHTYIDWPGAVHGGFSTITNIQPAMNTTSCSGGNSNPSCFVERYIQLQDNSGNKAMVGLDYNGLYCSSPSANLFMFYRYLDNSGKVKAAGCYPTTQKQIGKSIEIGVSFYASNGGGMLFWLHNTNDLSNNPCNPCSFAKGTTTWTHIYNVEDTYGIWTGGTLMPTTDWVSSRWMGLNGQIYNQTNGGFASSSNPPQLYWVRVPSNVNPGGDLKTCSVYSGLSCP